MEIKTELIQKFYQDFQNNQQNSALSETVLQQGVFKTAINPNLNLDNTFNLTLKESVFHNQFDSYQCNIYAGISVIKRNLAHNLEMDFNDLSISASYISFYDKLEKVNEAYCQIVELPSINCNEIVNIVNNVICQGGTFHSFIKLVKKYGIAPEEFMKDVNINYDPNIVFDLLKEKVKSDALKLLKVKENKQLFIEKLLNEVYHFLSIVLGNPPLVFTYEYQDKNKRMQVINNITPIDFSNKYLTLNLDKFITVTSFEVADFKNTCSYIPEIYMEDCEKIIKMELNLIKKSIINQLKHNMPIWFSCEINKTKNKELGIISDNIYDFNNLIKIDKLTRQESIALDLINYDHAMTIIGVNIEDNKITRYKVDDSLEMVKNFYVMSDSFFNNYVLTVILYEDYIIS